MRNSIILFICLLLLSVAPTNARAAFLQSIGSFFTGSEPVDEIPEPVEFEEPELSGVGEGGVSQVEKHDFLGMCADCHSESNPSGDSPPLLKKASQVCVACHSESVINSHPTNIEPSMVVPDDMPLNGGAVDCITCHNPCASDGVENMLRTSGQEILCQRCHVEGKTSGHAGNVVVAHPAKRTPSQKHGSLDAMSEKCVACHDGAEAPEAHFNLHGDDTMMLNLYVKQGSHKLGAVYEYVSQDTDLRNPEDVDTRISLYEGKVGCLSCHSPYSEIPKKLVMENAGSRLCLECHDK